MRRRDPRVTCHARADRPALSGARWTLAAARTSFVLHPPEPRTRPHRRPETPLTELPVSRTAPFRVAPCAIAILAAACATEIPTPTELVASRMDAGLTTNVAEFSISSNVTAEELVLNVASDGVNALVPYSRDRVVRGKLVSLATGGTIAAITGRHSLLVYAAYGMDVYLMVWQDDGDGAIWGMVVSAAGAAGTPFRISDKNHAYQIGGVAFSGDRFLVAYRGLYNEWVWARIVYPNGTVGGGFLLSTQGWVTGNSQVAGDGNGGFLVVWPAPSVSGTALRARKVTKAGAMNATITIDDNYVGERAGVAYADFSYLVVFSKDGGASGLDVYGQRVTPAGALGGDAFVIDASAGAQVAANVLAYGGRFLATWNDEQFPSTRARGRLVSKSGTLRARQTFFTRDEVTGKVPLVAGVAAFPKVFFAVSRSAWLADDTFHDLYDTDVHAAVVTP
jgi:hypothetical protein